MSRALTETSGTAQVSASADLTRAVWEARGEVFAALLGLTETVPEITTPEGLPEGLWEARGDVFAAHLRMAQPES